ncbi:MAG: hypothetical protein ACAI25_20680, partial [Planctomycetota bacterium]
MFLACPPRLGPTEAALSLLVPGAVLVLGMCAGMRRVGALLEPGRAEGVNALGLTFVAIDATLGATVLQGIASAMRLTRELGQLAF